MIREPVGYVSPDCRGGAHRGAPRGCFGAFLERDGAGVPTGRLCGGCDCDCHAKQYAGLRRLAREERWGARRG